jgi:hypothetical protein
VSFDDETNSIAEALADQAAGDAVTASDGGDDDLFDFCLQGSLLAPARRL